MRTLNEVEAAALMSKELRRMDIAIAGLQEVRWLLGTRCSCSLEVMIAVKCKDHSSGPGCAASGVVAGMGTDQ